MAAENYIPLHMQNVLDTEVRNDEQLLWAAQPGTGRAFKRALPILLFALAWLVFSSFVAYMVFTDTDVPFFPKAFISFFLLIGVLLLSAPYWMMRAAKNTIYAVTSKRAMIIKKGRAITVDNYGPEKLGDIDKRIFADGSGDLIFEKRISHHSHRSRGRSRSSQQVKEIGFFGIPKVNDVYDMILNMASQNAGKA